MTLTLPQRMDILTMFRSPLDVNVFGDDDAVIAAAKELGFTYVDGSVTRVSPFAGRDDAGELDTARRDALVLVAEAGAAGIKDSLLNAEFVGVDMLRVTNSLYGAGLIDIDRDGVVSCTPEIAKFVLAARDAEKAERLAPIVEWVLARLKSSDGKANLNDMFAAGRPAHPSDINDAVAALERDGKVIVDNDTLLVELVGYEPVVVETPVPTAPTVETTVETEDVKSTTVVPVKNDSFTPGNTSKSTTVEPKSDGSAPGNTPKPADLSATLDAVKAEVGEIKTAVHELGTQLITKKKESNYAETQLSEAPREVVQTLRRLVVLLHVRGATTRRTLKRGGLSQAQMTALDAAVELGVRVNAVKASGTEINVTDPYVVMDRRLFDAQVERQRQRDAERAVNPAPQRNQQRRRKPVSV